MHNSTDWDPARNPMCCARVFEHAAGVVIHLRHVDTTSREILARCDVVHDEIVALGSSRARWR